MYTAPKPRAGHPPRTLSSQNVVIKQHCSRFILIVCDKTQLDTIYAFPMFYEDLLGFERKVRQMVVTSNIYNLIFPVYDKPSFFTHVLYINPLPRQHVKLVASTTTLKLIISSKKTVRVTRSLQFIKAKVFT